VELGDAVRRRRMVRRYTGEPVDAGALHRILDLARRGPSAGFAQGQSFVVVTDDETRAAIAALCDEAAYTARGFPAWLSGAPVHVVPCTSRGAYEERYAAADKARSRGPAGWDVPYWWVDAGAALMLLLLGVVDEGLAAGFLDVEDTAGLRALLGIPGDVAPLGVVTIGHPAPDRPSSSLVRGRRPWDEVVHLGRWRGH
jgi:nitroreductase